MTIIRKAALCLATIVAAAGCTDRTIAPNAPVPPRVPRRRTEAPL